MVAWEFQRAGEAAWLGFLGQLGSSRTFLRALADPRTAYGCRMSQFFTTEPEASVCGISCETSQLLQTSQAKTANTRFQGKKEEENPGVGFKLEDQQLGKGSNRRTINYEGILLQQGGATPEPASNRISSTFHPS